MSCQDPDSNPYSFGSLFSHFRTVLKMDLGSLLFLPRCLLLNRPFNPRSCIRTSQSRTVEYGMASSLQIFRMLWPPFLRMHVSSLNFASWFLSFALALISFFLLTFGMNLYPISSPFCPAPDSTARPALSEPPEPSTLCFSSVVTIKKVLENDP